MSSNGFKRFQANSNDALLPPQSSYPALVCLISIYVFLSLLIYTKIYAYKVLWRSRGPIDSVWSLRDLAQAGLFFVSSKVQSNGIVPMGHGTISRFR
jgi:hypothetical protein